METTSLLSLAHQAADVVLHLDVHLNVWVAALGPWIYVLVFAIIFCETGLVVTPFLPGDSLLFALGALAATENSVLDVYGLAVLLSTAGILGDSANYAMGYRIGPRVFFSETSWWLNKAHLLRTQSFYERHGGKTIVLARFMPIIRTFAPFVAGIGAMKYSRFVLFNVVGGVAWCMSFLFAGYFFGNVPAVKQNFHIVIVAIIVISALPAMIGFYQSRRI